MSQQAFSFDEPEPAPNRLAPAGDILEFFGDYRFLSNFHEADVDMDGLVYPTVEHAYQAAKSKDPAERLRIRNMWLPGIAKKAGQKIDVEASWWNRRLPLMHGLVQRKFDRHADMRALLDATGTRRIVEGNWWGDTYWGVCRGQGQNWLGRILMAVRAGVPLEQVPWRAL